MEEKEKKKNEKKKKVWAACQTEKKQKEKQKHIFSESKFFDSSNREVSLNSKQDSGIETD